MKIKTKFILTSAVLVFFIFFILCVVFITNNQINQLAEEGKQYNEIVSNVFVLATLQNDYLLYHEDRASEQWHIQYDSLAGLLTHKKFSNSADQATLKKLYQDYQKLGAQFALLEQVKKNNQEISAQQQSNINVTPLEREYIVNLQLLSRSMVIESETLSQNNFSSRQSLRENTNITISVLMVLLFIAVISVAILFYKNIIGSIRRLQDGIEIISKGDLNYKIAISTQDEMGNITKAFNEMTIKLKYSFFELEKFKMAVDHASDQIVITDTQGMVIYANKATETITKYKISEALGKKAGSLWGGLMEKNFYENMWKVIKEEKKNFVGEITNKRKNGEKYITETHISPIVNEKNEVLFFVSIERDISRIKEIDKEKTEFVSIASHALRTPLGISKWYLEEIQNEGYMKDATAKAKSYFKEVSRNNERLLSLVRNLLSVSRIDQGKIKDYPTTVDAIKLIKQLMADMHIVASKNHIVLHLDIKSHEIPSMNIDQRRLHEVVENLVSNAIKYDSPHGKVYVTVDKVSNRLFISVKDTGIGISEEDQKKLFTKFFRSEKAVSSNTEGTGLGLYVIKSYIEGWGGKIEVKSQEGKGAIFSVEIPFNPKYPTNHE